MPPKLLLLMLLFPCLAQRSQPPRVAAKATPKSTCAQEISSPHIRQSKAISIIRARPESILKRPRQLNIIPPYLLQIKNLLVLTIKVSIIQYASNFVNVHILTFFNILNYN